ncbi:metallophosphoesterase family protein [Bacillus massilinigeriensis]|uniref:metallophosphoesterase family protein n=1 Tax=Bacillus mediterraneensis TaxID=1805474 RepID=UPI0008F873F6|nr:metallophosphoesterase [Bacillus mediterraneensis]
MKIVILSDTHLPKRGRVLSKVIKREIEDASLIIHAGDWQTVEVYKEIHQLAPLVGVMGNVDSPELRRYLKEKEILEVEGKRIGIIHGHGKGRSTKQRAVEAFKGDDVDAIIFGHSHIPSLQYIEGTLLFNPGSPTDKRRQKDFSFGIFTIGEELIAEHVFFSKVEDGK